MNETAQKVTNDKWEKVVVKTQMIIAFGVFITEVVGNAMLYATRSQGYGPDTIVEKLIRYLLITTIFNFGMIIIGQIVIRFSKTEDTKRFVLMLCTTLICTDVAFSHYQFASTLMVFTVPILISILYEDISLTFVTFVMSLVGQGIASLARAMDPLYNKDIGPEYAIAFVTTVSVYLLSKVVHKSLRASKVRVGEALVEVEKAKASAERAKFSFKMLETLAKAIDAKDKYTNGHSIRVAVYATKLAEAIGWDADKIEMLECEALLHDIGKISVPDSVLNKPGRLNDVEFNIIKSHSLVGSEILRNMIVVPNSYLVAKYHHERYDGKGYPTGVAGDKIPLAARIVCIADSYDAMSSDRIYRKALSKDVIREELVKGRGTQFDPELLDVFLKLFDENKLKINTKELSFVGASEEQEYVLEDIERVIRNMAIVEESNASASDFDKFYKYMRNIGLRYNQSIEVLSIILTPVDDEVSLDDEEVASNALEVSIRKNIRSVDVYHRYSNLRHVAILLDAGIDNIDVITQRITFDFKLTDRFKLSFEVNEQFNEKTEEHQKEE